MVDTGQDVDTDEQYVEKAKNTLREFGVQDPQVGDSGTIPIDEPGEFRILEYNIEETTPRYRQIANSLPRKGDERIINKTYSRPLCNILGCNALSLLPVDCTKTTEEFIDPEINIRSTPSRVPNAEANLNATPLSPPPNIQGEVQISGENFSQPGKVIEETVHKCKSESEEETEVIDESAIVSMESNHNVVVDSVNETLTTVQSVIPTVSPDVSKTTNVSFRKEGAFDLLKGIADVMVTGSMTANVTGSVKVEYKWRDKVNTRTFDINTTARIPVDNMDYSL